MPDLISVAEAISALISARPDPGRERVTLDEANGRVLAQDVKARLTLPPHPVSAMDGYAVRLEDVKAPGARLSLIGESPAGRPFSGTVGAGQAVRIFTGGHVPAGADHIVIQEDTRREDDDVCVPDAHETARHIRKAGLDFSGGDLLIAAGTRLGPGEIAIAAASNHDGLVVRRRPRIALIANGDELKPPGAEPQPGDVISSNPAALSALVQSWGGAAVDLGIAEDSVAGIQACLEKAAASDILVPIGGASVGDYDYMKTAFCESGFETVFEKIAVRPGKPTWLARRGDQCVLGLPGNPASAYVCAQLFLKPLLGFSDGLDLLPMKTVEDLGANGPRETFLRASARIEDDGQISIQPLSRQDSSLMTPFLKANILLRRAPHAEAVPAGSRVEGIQIGPLGRA